MRNSQLRTSKDTYVRRRLTISRRRPRRRKRVRLRRNLPNPLIPRRVLLRLKSPNLLPRPKRVRLQRRKPRVKRLLSLPARLRRPNQRQAPSVQSLRRTPSPPNPRLLPRSPAPPKSRRLRRKLPRLRPPQLKLLSQWLTNNHQQSQRLLKSHPGSHRLSRNLQ